MELRKLSLPITGLAFTFLLFTGCMGQESKTDIPPVFCATYIPDPSFQVEVNDHRGKPISDALVFASNGSTSPSTQLDLEEDSDSPGHYKAVANSGVYTLYVRKLGYKELALGSLNIESTNCGNLVIPVTYQKLELTLDKE